MKVTTDTPDLLIVEDRPIILAIALIAFILVFVGIGLGMTFSGELWGLMFALFGGGLGFAAFWAFVRRVQVVFHRPDGYVEFRRRNLFAAQSLRHTLAEIDRAEIEESRSSNSSPTFRVVLVISKGESAGHHPVTFAFSNSSGHYLCADAINAWLDAGRS